MPLRNRVNPFGEIEAVPERGLIMGNRGCLINPRRQLIVDFRLQCWISCVLEFKGRRRPLMTPGKWTELFFLDEATALAAGHRPCFECRRPAAQRFLQLWNQANGQHLTHFPELDRTLHTERLSKDQPLTLANGAFVASGQQALLCWDGRFHPWTPAGYQAPITDPGNLRQLTPPSIARTLAAGYAPLLHPSK
jgi:hypothetical protein